MADTPATPTPPGNGPTDGQQGGGDSNATPPAPPAPQQQNQQGPTPAPSSEPGGTQSPEQPGEQGIEHASREDLLSEVQRLRRENHRRRADTQNATEQAQQTLVQQIASALGITQEGEENTPSVESLTSQLEQSQQAQRQRDVEFAAWRAAAKAELDPEVLLNQVSFQKRIADLDPNKESFDDDIAQAINEEKTANSLFKGEEPEPRRFPGRSSRPLNNQRGSDGKGDDGQSPAELVKAITDRTPY